MAKTNVASSSNGTTLKGLRPLQIKVLQLLAKQATGQPPWGVLTRTSMYEALGFKTQSGLNDILGKNDPAKRAEADAAKYPSLLTLGYIKLSTTSSKDDQPKERVYSITAKGKKAVAKIKE